MGVRTIIGEVDGTNHGAAMFDSVTGEMLGFIWEAEDAEDQIEAFLVWLRSHYDEARAFAVAKAQTGQRLHREGADGSDVRHWTNAALESIISGWRAEHLDDDGLLKLTDEQVEIARDAEDDLR